MVALQATVHDGGVSLLRDTLLGDLGVDPFGKAPHLRADLAKFHRGGGVVLDGVLECLVEVAIVQEDVGVVVPPVEVALDRLDGLNDTVQLLISGQDDESAVGTRLASVGLEAAFDKDLVILFADFPTSARWSMGQSWGVTGEGGSPYSWRGSSGHEHAPWGVWMPHKEDEDEDNDD